MNGNDIMLKADDRMIANNSAPTPIKNPNIANKIFIPINHMNPSKFQLKIRPGNLIVNLEHHKNTYTMYEPERIQ